MGQAPSSENITKSLTNNITNVATNVIQSSASTISSNQSFKMDCNAYRQKTNDCYAIVGNNDKIITKDMTEAEKTHLLNTLCNAPCSADNITFDGIISAKLDTGQYAQLESTLTAEIEKSLKQTTSQELDGGIFSFLDTSSPKVKNVIHTESNNIANIITNALQTVIDDEFSTQSISIDGGVTSFIVMKSVINKISKNEQITKNIAASVSNVAEVFDQSIKQSRKTSNILVGIIIGIIIFLIVLGVGIWLVKRNKRQNKAYEESPKKKQRGGNNNNDNDNTNNTNTNQASKSNTSSRNTDQEGGIVITNDDYYKKPAIPEADGVIYDNQNKKKTSKKKVKKMKALNDTIDWGDDDFNDIDFSDQLSDYTSPDRKTPKDVQSSSVKNVKISPVLNDPLRSTKRHPPLPSIPTIPDKKQGAPGIPPLTSKHDTTQSDAKTNVKVSGVNLGPQFSKPNPDIPPLPPRTSNTDVKASGINLGSKFSKRRIVY
jgi:hypothetical protein